MLHAARRWACAVLVAVAVALGTGAVPASAHSFSSTVYADLSSPERGEVRAELRLDYYLLVVSAGDYEQNEGLAQEGSAALETGDVTAQAAVLDAHGESVVAYVTERFGITAEGETCTPVREENFAVEERDEELSYAVLVLDYRCPESAGAHEVRSELFPDAEGYVPDAKTIVSYDLDLNSGSAVLDAKQRSFSTQQSWTQWFRAFFRLGAEHLLAGLDHILFLLALIVGSRRLREIVLAATAFTLAHSVTFVLAAVGLVQVPGWFVEPAIALSIAIVAGWYLWRSWRRGSDAAGLEPVGRSHLSLDRAGWARLGVVFCFGLVHGLGFATALGIDEPWSWKLQWSLLVFNLGIEVVQLAIILVVFPLLAVVRRRAPVTGLWTTVAISAGVAVMGVVWFVQRVLGL